VKGGQRQNLRSLGVSDRRRPASYDAAAVKIEHEVSASGLLLDQGTSGHVVADDRRLAVDDRLRHRSQLTAAASQRNDQT
jgi:hypothetical protein